MTILADRDINKDQSKTYFSLRDKSETKKVFKGPTNYGKKNDKTNFLRKKIDFFLKRN
jgi:hypothetical protein